MEHWNFRLNLEGSKMKKIKTAIIAVLMLVLIPLQVNASTYWTGNGAYYPDKSEEWWGLTDDVIYKETDVGRVYSIDDIENYSAYFSLYGEDIGNYISKAFRWINQSRLGYVKLIKVTPGQEVSFLFSEERYVYCAEFTSDYKLIKPGDWMSTGDVLRLQQETEWIIMVFRMPNGDFDYGGGYTNKITVADMASLTHKYLILEPFNYTFKLNGGKYENNERDFMIERLGVEKMTLPVPVRDGYEFMGWISSGGNSYTGTLPSVYNEDLFKDTTFNASWRAVMPEGITLNETEIVLEENSDETFILTAEIIPYNALDKTIRWSSSNEAIARVDEKGVVYPGKTGIATITATASNGITSTCKVYVMGFEIELPSYCEVNQIYEIKVEVFNNGKQDTKGRKRVVLVSDSEVELIRTGDSSTKCEVLSETALEYGGNYKGITNTIIDTDKTTSVYLRLSPKNVIKKSGDYEGNISFTVSVNNQ